MNEMVEKHKSSESGVSVVELLIVFAITAVLVVFAVAQFGNAEETFDTQNIAREFKVNLERARFDSVKRRPQADANLARIQIDDPSEFSVFLDLDRNGLIQPGDKKVVDLTQTGNMKFLMDGVSLPVIIAFDRRGKVRATDSIGNPINPVFTICNNCTALTASANNAYVVSVSPTGTVRMSRFGDTPPSLTDPTVSTVSTGSDIDPMVADNAGGAPAGTPAVTPTPDPSPSATPIPTPSPTPTPINPTPTPTPQDICYRNERPAESGCLCQAPMTVRGNGQCK